MKSLRVLEAEARACTQCVPHLPFGPRPVFQVHTKARILIAGQAPGRKVHESGVPFDDASGDRLREWLGVTREEFYDSTLIAIMPMGFCYPGTGRSGDLPPRTDVARCVAPRRATPTSKSAQQHLAQAESVVRGRGIVGAARARSRGTRGAALNPVSLLRRSDYRRPYR